MPIENVSDTARWVAYYRAMETQRPDAIFRDPFAERLAGDAGRAMVDEMPGGRSTAWAMIVRTAIFDGLILEYVNSHGADTVLNLAAGLDARPWRLALPSRLRWIDVDLPGILSQKSSLLSGESPRCRYEAVHADLNDAETRRALFARVGAEGDRVLVVTEGLLGYLTEPQVGALAMDLHGPASFRWWLIDLLSPRLLKMINRNWGKKLERGNTPLQFAPAEGSGFFRRFGWHEALFRSSLEEAHRLGREPRMIWVWRLLARLSSRARREEFRRMAAYILFDRDLNPPAA